MPATTPSLFTRASLLPCILLMSAAVVPASATSQTPERTDWELLARDLFEELVEINTSHSVGGTLEASRAMAQRLLDAGFPEEDVIVTEVAPNEGNLVARLPGTNASRKGVLLLAHIDVVEAHPEDWTLPPFEFIEQDGNFYGRGVADDKDEAAIYVANLMRMRAEGFQPDRDIIVALTADEEGGSHNGVAWLLENRPDLMDVEYAFNEGGGGTLRDGMPVSNNVQASEKKYLNFTVEATNPGGHSSVPRPDNAIYELSRALLGIGRYEFPVRLNEVTRAYFQETSKLVDVTTSAMMRRVLTDPTDQEAVRYVAREPGYNSRMRTTCVATLLDGGHAPNALPQRATANVNCRILPDADPEEVLGRLRAAVGEAEVTVSMEGFARNSPPSPLVDDVLGPIARITEELWPGTPVIPTMSTGATDALYLRNAGIPVYGVSGLFYENPNAHGMNENIPVQSFYDGQEFLYRLVKAVSSPGIS